MCWCADADKDGDSKDMKELNENDVTAGRFCYFVFEILV